MELKRDPRTSFTCDGVAGKRRQPGGRVRLAVICEWSECELSVEPKETRLRSRAELVRLSRRASHRTVGENEEEVVAFADQLKPTSWTAPLACSP